MINKLGKKNLFICLNDKVSALPLAQFVETLKKISPEQSCVVLVDEKQKNLFGKFESDSLIFLSKESFANSSPFSSQILCNMKSIDQQMKNIEQMGFDRVFQLGPIQWGRWMLSDLNQKVLTLPLDDAKKTAPWAVMSMLCRFFDIRPELMDLSKKTILVHPYSDNELDWHFLATLKNIKSSKHPWIELAIHESDKKALMDYEGDLSLHFYHNYDDLIESECLIVSFDPSLGGASSLAGLPSGWVTETGQKKDFEAFYPNSFVLTINSEEFSSQEFVTALGYWRAGRLSELAFLNIQSHFQIENIQLVGDCLSLSSVSQNFEEYHFIKKVLTTYKEASTHGNQAQIADMVLEHLMNYRFEKYLFYSGIKSLKYVVEMMIIANKRGERAFKKFSNDFYKISIADEVFEALLSGDEASTQIFNKLNKLLNFLQTLEYSGESIIESSLEIS